MNETDEEKFVKCKGFNVEGTLDKIKRSDDFMSPIFEALSNSLDATRERGEVPPKPITITFDFSSLSRDGAVGKSLTSVEIRDFGVGFNRENYDRFLSLNDRSKSAFNKGTGRVQFVKAFTRADYESVFFEGEGASRVLMRRAFSFSATPPFLSRNALVYVETDAATVDASQREPETVLRLLAPFVDDTSGRFGKTTVADIKERLLARFFLRLNDERNAPQIDVVFRINGVENDRATITRGDFPAPRKEVEIAVPYKRVEYVGGRRRFFSTGERARFRVAGYALRGECFTGNLETFVSRGETVGNAKLGLSNANEQIGDFYYAVAISGERVDAGVSEARDGVYLPNDKDFPDAPLFGDAAADVSLDDVQKEARKACAEIFPELAAKKNELEGRVARVGKQFGFAKSTIEAAQKNMPLNAQTGAILKRLYAKEGDYAARKDARINDLLESVKELDPTSATYQEEAKERADRLLELTPEPNKAALAHCFARRKITLELLGDVLNQKLDAQTQGGRGKEESFLHNVLFRQKTNAPATSDLWILDEEFVYFSGTSDVPLGDVEYDGKKILASLEDCTPTEKEFLQDRRNKRPDILLFPDEGKCVVVELKAPNVNLSKHIGQVSQYASLIFNYSAPEFKFDRFFLYLIGGKIEPRDIYGADEHFQFAPKGGYMFKTQPLRSFTPNRPDGEAYYEIHTYESIYERAKARNKTFLDLLLNDGREE